MYMLSSAFALAIFFILTHKISYDKTTRMDDNLPVHESRGALLDVGTSAIVELLPNGKEVVKTPLPGPEHEQCRRDMQIEASVYRRLHNLGPHPRFLQLISFDEANGTITLPYMAAGTLRNFLQTQAEKIGLQQRLQWCLEAAEGMEVLHSVNVVHWDFSPKNILLDKEYGLKIADFGCSSIEENRSSGIGDVRFYPRSDSSTSRTTTLDVFALGSTMFEILTGVAPLRDVSSSRVGDCMQRGELPTLEAVELGHIISQCWSYQEQDVGRVRHAVADAIDARSK